jgi:uncharacterized membrane protein
MTSVAVLRLIHITAGVFWAGSVMLMGWFVAPAAKAAGPGAGPFMQALLKKRITVVLISAGLVTVGAGIWLWALRRPTMGRWQDWALAIGALAAIVAIVLGIGFQRPTGSKLQALGATLASAGGPPTAEQGAEMGRLQARMSKFGSILAILLVVAVAGMALGG